MSQPQHPSTFPDEDHRGSTKEHQATPGRMALATAFILIPVALALCVPLYQRTDPTLGGMPFFFWFQILMAVLAAAGCGSAYLLIFRNESEEC